MNEVAVSDSAQGTIYASLSTAADAGIAAAAPLPSPQGVALEVMRQTRSDKVTVVQIAKTLQADPALSGRLIKAANTASQAAHRPVASVRDAITVLGLSTVRQLALGFSLISNYRNGSCTSFDYQSFWSRSLLLAVAAQAVARHVRLAAPEEMFACGMLADIGRMAFATLYPADYSRILDETGGRAESDLRAIEQKRFGIDHAEMSALMLKDWGFPDVFTSIVSALPCDRRGAPIIETRERALLEALRLANSLSDYCFAEQHRRRLLPLLIAKAARSGIDMEDLGAMADDILRQWHDWAKILQVSDAGVANCGDEIREGISEQNEVAVNDASNASMRVLIVDDDREVLSSLKCLLEGAGHVVRVARDGDEALSIVIDFIPQLLLTDLDMPGMDGIRLCSVLRQTEMGRDMYVIAITSSEDDGHLQEAFSAGIDDYVSKPVSSRLLQVRLRSAQRALGQQEQLSRDIETIRTLAADLATNNRQLQQAAATDPLTGLPNRRYMLERINQAWASSRRRGSPMSCIAIDIDHFKRINDTRGHAVGDAALRHVSGLLRSKARLQDMVARMGGEEFLVICPDTQLEDAFQCAERLRAALVEAPFNCDSVSMNITFSAGVASVNKRIESPEALLKAADEAMYRAKQTGRNRVACARQAMVFSMGAGRS